MPITVECPFYKWDESEKRGKNTLCCIYCEGGKLKMPDFIQKHAYLKTYCANMSGWKQCSVARALFAFYDREERERIEEESGDL